MKLLKLSHISFSHNYKKKTSHRQSIMNPWALLLLYRQPILQFRTHFTYLAISCYLKYFLKWTCVEVFLKSNFHKNILEKPGHEKTLIFGIPKSEQNFPSLLICKLNLEVGVDIFGYFLVKGHFLLKALRIYHADSKTRRGESNQRIRLTRSE